MSRDVRAETGLVRAAGLWSTGPAQLELPLSVNGISGPVRASGRLQLTPDLDVFAWICERWAKWSGLNASERWAPFTLHELATALYGSDPDYRNRQAVRESILRLLAVTVTLPGYDAQTGETRPGVVSHDRLLDRLVSELDRVGDDPVAIGALRGSTFRAQLAPWLAQSLAAGSYTYLDFATLRRLDGLAKRVWVYLEAERYKRVAADRAATWIGLGGPGLATLGADTYARHRDARAALDRAGKRIVAADSRYLSVQVERRPGGHALVAVRAVTEQQRRQRQQLEQTGVAPIGSTVPADWRPPEPGKRPPRGHLAPPASSRLF